jgi:C4-dicarboxylate-specific signal transduction histidine kinase
MDVFDWVLLALGSMVAVGALARLMLQRRDQLLTELDQQARQEQEQRRLAELLRRKKQKEK